MRTPLQHLGSLIAVVFALQLVWSGTAHKDSIQSSASRRRRRGKALRAVQAVRSNTENIFVEVEDSIKFDGDTENEVVNSLKYEASGTVQKFTPRLIISKNYAANTCGYESNKGKNSKCCHGDYDNTLVPEKSKGDNNKLLKFKDVNACPVNIGGFESFLPKKNQDSASMYDIQHDHGEVIVGVLSTIGAPAATLAKQVDNVNLDKHENTHPGGAQWWTKVKKSNDKVTTNFKDLRMSFGATQSDSQNPQGAEWLSVQFDQIIEFHDGNNDGMFNTDRVAVLCDSIVVDPSDNKKKSVKEYESGKDCYYQSVSLHEDLLWKPGYHESEVSKDNPIQNISSKTKYTVSSARSIAGPFKDKEDHVKISMESSGVTRAISSTNPAIDKESFLTPNSTRVMIEIKDFPYKNKNTDSKSSYSKLALKTQFGSSGKTDNKVVYKVGSRITVTQGGSGKKIGYFHWAEYVEIKNEAASTTSWHHVSSNCAMDMTSREKSKRKFCGRFMGNKHLGDIAFGQLKAQVQPYPLEKTIYTYFTLGDSVTVQNPKLIRWEISMGLGDAPLPSDDPRMFLFVVCTIMVIGCCLCIVREKFDEKSGKRWGYPPELEFATIGHDTIGTYDKTITLVFNEPVFKNEDIDKRDFEVIIHQEKCIANGLYKGYKCRCKQDAINKRTLRPKDDTYFGKVNVVDAKVNYTVGKTSVKGKYHGTVQLMLGSSWVVNVEADEDGHMRKDSKDIPVANKRAKIEEVLAKAKMITIAYTRKIKDNDVEASKVMNFCRLSHLRNICLHGDVMNSIRLCCKCEEEEVRLKQKRGKNPCIGDKYGNSVKSFIGQQVYNFVGKDNFDEYEISETVRVKGEEIKLMDYNKLSELDNWWKLVDDDVEEDDEEADMSGRGSTSRKSEKEMQSHENNDGSEETEGLLKGHKKRT